MFVPIWPVSSHTNAMTGLIGTTRPNLYPLAGDDRPLTLLEGAVQTRMGLELAD